MIKHVGFSFYKKIKYQRAGYTQYYSVPKLSAKQVIVDQKAYN
jgi:hypothetical protein